MVVRQQAWNSHEAAILLQAYIEFCKGNESRQFYIRRVSEDLRKMAISQGIDIDDKYRNVNGITFQMASMESAFLGHTIMKPASKLFTDTVLLYKDHKPDFDNLLKEAKDMINNSKSNKDRFFEYVASKVSSTQLSAFYQCYGIIEDFCLKIKVLRAPLFETTDLDTIKKVQKTIEQNRIFVITHRKKHGLIVSAGRYYLEYVKNGLAEKAPVDTCSDDISNIANIERDDSPAKHESSDDSNVSSKLNSVITALKARYSTEKATSLTSIIVNNKDLPITSINAWSKLLYNKTAGQYLIDQGILVAQEREEQTEEEKEASEREKLRSCMEVLQSRYENKAAGSLAEVRANNPDVSLTYFNTWTQKFYGKTASQFLIDNGIIRPVEKKSPREKIEEAMQIIRPYFADKKALTIAQVERCDFGSTIISLGNWVKSEYNCSLYDYLVKENILEPKKDSASSIEERVKLVSEMYRRDHISDYDDCSADDSNEEIEASIEPRSVQEEHATSALSPLEVDEGKKANLDAASDSICSAEERIKALLKEETEKNKYGTTLTYIQSALSIPGYEARRILSNASWASYRYGRYFYVAEVSTVPAEKKAMASQTVQSNYDLVVRNDQDKRLYSKFPVIYKRVLKSLQNLTERDSGASIVGIYEDIGRIARCSDIEDILNNVSWASCKGKIYSFSKEPVDHSSRSEKGDNKPADENTKIVNFERLEDLPYTVPISIDYFGVNRSGFSAWRDLYIVTLSLLYDDYPSLIKPGMSFSTKIGGRIDLGTSSHKLYMVAPRAIPNTDLFLETNVSASDIVSKIKYLLDYCSVDYENVVIKFVKKNDSVSAKNSDSSLPGKQSKTIKAVSIEAAFETYLRESLSMADASCRSYVSAIRSAERFAKEHRFDSTALYTSDINIAKATAAELFKNQMFLKYNADQHNRFVAAMKKYLVFLEETSVKLEKTEPQARKQETESEAQFRSAGRVDSSPISPRINDADISEKTRQILNVPSKAPEKDNADIKKVLTAHYEYGFKLDSIRELLRFRQFAESLGVSLPENDEDLKTAILSAGTVIEDRVYCKKDDLPLMLQNLVNEVSASGISVVYYESLFGKNAEQMSSYVITSEEMLKEYLQQYVSGWAFSKKFMTKDQKKTERNAVTDELRRVWGDTQTVSVSELSNRLPYIPLSNIWRVISGNDLFVLVSEGVYLFLERFHISENEAEDILDYVETTCEENGFASLSDVPLGDIEEENYLLSSLAIYNAVFKKVLSDKYTLNGKIITKGNPDLDAIALLKHYISGKEECSFDEIADKLIDLIGGVNRQYAFQALYDDMVRVDISRYVSNQSVSFNVDMIDSVISSFITDKFGAIKDITTFAMFPICGQNWNHYLLESYCYKYSKKYSLHVIHFNDKNAGIIAEKEFNIPYNEMLALALSKADVELSPEVIGPYLFNTGYLSKSKYAKLADIAQKAKELKKQR